MLARRHIVGAIAGDQRCGNSDDICISSGSKNDEDAVDLCFHYVECLSGGPMKPASLAVNVDHSWKKMQCEGGWMCGWMD